MYATVLDDGKLNESIEDPSDRLNLRMQVRAWFEERFGIDISVNYYRTQESTIFRWSDGMTKELIEK